MAIDALAMPMLIVDKTATILHLNAAADGLLNQKPGGLVCKMGKLSTTNPAQRKLVASLIASATSHPAVGLYFYKLATIIANCLPRLCQRHPLLLRTFKRHWPWFLLWNRQPLIGVALARPVIRFIPC